MSDYDVIVIGSGAGGGTLVHRLASIRQEDPSAGARGLPDSRAAELAGRGRLRRRPLPVGGHLVRRQGQAVRPAGALLRRRRDQDVRRGALPPARRGLRRGPVRGWRLAGLAHLLRRDGALLHAGGGALPGARCSRRGPHGAPASAPYPFPAVSHEPRIQQLSDDLAAAGYRPFHAPCGVMLDEANMPYSTCVRCDDCDGFPCLVHAKSDAEVIAVRPALEHANVTLLTNSEAVALNTDAGGEAVTEVVVERDGERETYSADIVAVSCGAANSAKLLLASATDKHPNGLANGSDQVGRNYMFHNSQAVLALSKEPNPTVFQKTLGLNDFYFAGEEFDHPLGNIQMVGKSQAPMFRGEKPIGDEAGPGWSLEKIAAHAVDFWLSTEDLPKPDNRVTLTDDGAIRLSYTYSNEKPKKELYDKLKSILGDIGMHKGHLLPHHAYLKNEIPVAGVAHQTGTCRFGTDPADSVLDTNCKAHELDNLYVVDTSFVPEHRRRQPGAHGDGQRPAGGRPPARASGRLGGSQGPTMASESPSSRDRGRRFRRVVRRAQAASRPGPSDARGPPQPPPLPADALSGRHRDPLGGRDRTADSKRAAAPAKRRGRAGRGQRLRPGGSQGDGHAPRRKPHRDPVRQPDRRGRRRPVLLRSRRVLALGTGHEDDQRRPRASRAGSWAPSRWPSSRPIPETTEGLTFVVVGGGPTGVEIAGQIAELSRRVLKNDFRRDRSTQRQDPRSSTAARRCSPPSATGCPARRRRASSASESSCTCRASSRTSIGPAWSSSRGTTSAGSRAHQGLGGRRPGLPAGPDAGRPPAPRWTAPGASACSPIARCPGTRGVRDRRHDVPR